MDDEWFYVALFKLWYSVVYGLPFHYGKFFHMQQREIDFIVCKFYRAVANPHEVIMTINFLCDELITTKTLIRSFSLSKTFLIGYVAKGHVRVKKIGNSLLWDGVAAFNYWLDRNKFSGLNFKKSISEKKHLFS